MKRCTALTAKGLRCKRPRLSGKPFCTTHARVNAKPKPGEKVNYRAYMNSKAWQAKRQEYMRSRYTSNDCYGCGRPYMKGFNLHHLTYKRLGHERLSDLRMVCAPCHEAIHELAKVIGSIAKATHRIRLEHGLGIPAKLRR